MDNVEKKPVDCSGTPASCPDNEGYGCACSADDAPQVAAKLPKWIDDKKGSDPLVDDLIAYIEQIAGPQVVADERAAFEVEERKNTTNLQRQSDGQYENPCMQSAWEGWRARAALAAAPVQAQEPVACKTCDGTGTVSDGEINTYPDGTPYMNGPVKCVKDCPDCAKPVAPVQPVAVPDGWPTDEMVVRGAEQLHDCLRSAGVEHGFDADLKGTEIQQDIAESVFKSMMEFAAPAAQGDALIESNLREIIAKTSDDYARYVAQTTLAAIAAKAAS